MTGQAETFDFQVETRQLLQLMINSVYSDKDLFLRELISNSSDALDKLRVERFRDDALDADTSDLHIELDVDPEARTLTVRDNGIGMSREEVVDLIGKIANSGTAAFVKDLTEAQKSGTGTEELIGRFGVGFYSSFMVADRVSLLTRRAGQSGGTRWESAGEGTYTIEDVEGAPQGTAVTLHLKPADPEDGLFDYTQTWKVREIVTRYSDFITWPIRMAVPATPEVADEGDEAGEDGTAEADVPKPAVMETINSRKALWARPAAEVTEEDYAELYRKVSHDWNAPLETIRLNIEGTLQYQALLFLPAHASADLFTQGVKRGVQLYVNRVFVMDDCEALVPSYLRFVKGVLDSSDLALNVSREILQQDRQIEAMRKRLTRRVLSTIKTMAADEPDKYATFWKEFGQVVKEGLLQDFGNRDAILEICSFETTHDPQARTTLREYLDRAGGDDTDTDPAADSAGGEGQESPSTPATSSTSASIYYMTGDSRLAIENSPYMEAFKAKGLEVLLLTDPIDEIWVDAIGEFDGKPFQSITKGELDLDDADEAEKTAREQRQEQFAPLLSWMTSLLKDDLKEVRLTSRLTVSPACIVSDAGDATPALINLYRQMGQHLPESKRILELNPDHELVSGLRTAHAARPEDAKLAETTELVYGLALLAEGGQLPDPSRFVNLMADHLGKSL
jgi:molecular chaperone HtpG